MSSTTANATSTVTNARCVRRDDPPLVVRPVDARSTAPGCTRVPRNAGSTPNSSVVITINPAVNPAIKITKAAGPSGKKVDPKADAKAKPAAKPAAAPAAKK